MTKNVEIVKRLFDACAQKDVETVKSLVHPNYTLKDPLMDINGLDEMIEMMQDCPFDMKVKNLQIISEGDKVVSTFDSQASQPVAATVRMCSIATLENGKVRSEEIFYDTAQIPEEFKKMAKQTASSKKNAA